MHKFRPLILVLIPLLAALSPAAAWALAPDQILLIINKNSPDSAKLAALYAQMRDIPPGRTITLDVPNAEEMEFDDYEHNVVPPIRQFLKDNHLEKKITCLLTFYGVPFRIRARHNSPDDARELAQLQADQEKTLDDLKAAVAELETSAAALDPTFKPETKDDLPALAQRATAASKACAVQISQMSDLQQKAKSSATFTQSLLKLGGVGELDARFGAEQRALPHDKPEETQKWIDLHTAVTAAANRAKELQTRRYDHDSRTELLDIVKKNFGLVGAAEVTQAEIAYFDMKDTNSAVDNELALLWWDYYPRTRWQLNPLNYRAHGQSPHTLMVMRLDAPHPEIVEKIIHTSIDVEKAGLQGVVALDARGIKPIDDKQKPDPYGQYDEHIRNLAAILQTKTSLQVVLDDKPAVFAPGSVKHVALYCGWYSLSHYIPGCIFNAGAVGYHIASGEMENLHGDTPHEWVHGLLTDGVVATLGPCAEPYLSSFPYPDDFFPLLLTGKLPLAEVYWKTTPMTSWMISCIGDPLYTPYKNDPMMKVEDLTPDQQAIFTTPSTRSTQATQPNDR